MGRGPAGNIAKLTLFARRHKSIFIQLRIGLAFPRPFLHQICLQAPSDRINHELAQERQELPAVQ